MDNILSEQFFSLMEQATQWNYKNAPTNKGWVRDLTIIIAVNWYHTVVTSCPEMPWNLQYIIIFTNQTIN